MNNGLLARVMRATELTRAGRLAEATAMLRGTHRDGGDTHDTVGPRGAANDDVIEGVCTEAREEAETATPETTSPPSPEPARGAAQPGWLRRFVSREWSAPQDAAARATAATVAGQFITGQYGNAAGERAYKLYIPTRYTGQPLPLVVMLHGCTQNPDDFAAGTQMNTLGDAQDCFVLYPAQSKSANASQCWNWFRPEDQARDSGEPSIIAEMTAMVVQRYNVDARRIYVAGMSAGGAMAAVMAVAYPERFAAVGIHSGLASGSAHDMMSALAAMKGMPAVFGAGTATPNAKPHATPMIVFHGDRDKTVHPRNGAEVIAQSAHSQDADAAQVTTERGRAAAGHEYTRTIHRDSSGSVVLEHWLVHGGGHAWFGGSPAGSHTDARGPNATQEMLRFFLQRA